MISNLKRKKEEGEGEEEEEKEEGSERGLFLQCLFKHWSAEHS